MVSIKFNGYMKKFSPSLTQNDTNFPFARLLQLWTQFSRVFCFVLVRHLIFLLLLFVCLFVCFLSFLDFRVKGFGIYPLRRYLSSCFDVTCKSQRSLFGSCDSLLGFGV